MVINKTNLKIIIVDDHEIYRKSLVKIISKILPTCHIEEAIDGRHFLELITRDTKIDLAIVDIKMPVLGGIEATRLARHLVPDLKILGISMYHSEENKRLMFAAGAIGFIWKGGDRNEIENAITTLLKEKHS